MREKNSERPDTRDNRSKNSTKTGKKNTKNREFAVITYSFLALFICLMGYFSYFQFFKSEEFINNPYNTRLCDFPVPLLHFADMPDNNPLPGLRNHLPSGS